MKSFNNQRMNFNNMKNKNIQHRFILFKKVRVLIIKNKFYLFYFDKKKKIFKLKLTDQN